MACYPVFHAITKYIELDVHFVRSLVADQKLQVRYVPTESQHADLLNPHGLHVLEETNICNKILLDSPSVYLNTNPSSIKLLEFLHKFSSLWYVLQPSTCIGDFNDVILYQKREGEVDMIIRKVERKVTDDHNKDLVAPFVEREVKEAIFSMYPDKSLGQIVLIHVFTTRKIEKSDVK